MSDYAAMSDADLMALVQPKAASSDFSKMSDADLLKTIGQPPATKTKSSGAMDFFKSIPGGLVEGLSTAASALGKTTAAEMGQHDLAAEIPDPQQGARLTERHLTGELPQPQGSSGKYGRAVGATLGNPVSYVGPGGLPIKLLTGTTSAVGGEAGREFGGTPGQIMGGLLGAVAPGATAKAITPFAASPRQAALVTALEDKGVTSLTAGQRTGSPVLQSIENKIGNTPGTGFAAERIAGEGERQFTQSIMRDLGEGGMATKPELQKAQDRIGGTFKDLSARNDLTSDAKMITDVINTARRYDAVLDANQRPIFDKLLGNITDAAVSGGMTGQEYQIARSQLGGKARGLQTTDPESAKAFKGLQRALDDTMERGLSPADKQAWRTARDEYGRLKDVEGAVPKSGNALVEGKIDPAALNQTISAGKDASAAARGQLPYSKTAEAAAGVMVPPQRAALSQPTLSGMTLGAPSAAIGRLLMSPIGQRYAGNQFLAGFPSSEGAMTRALANALMQVR